jgi:hypothetical protein
VPRPVAKQNDGPLTRISPSHRLCSDRVTGVPLPKAHPTLPNQRRRHVATVLDARTYMLRLSKDRERRQRAAELLLVEADVGRSPSRLNWHYSLKPNLILRQWHNHRASSAMTVLLLKRASVSRPSGKWNEDDYDVLSDDEVVGRIY